MRLRAPQPTVRTIVTGLLNDNGMDGPFSAIGLRRFWGSKMCGGGVAILSTPTLVRRFRLELVLGPALLKDYRRTPPRD